MDPEATQQGAEAVNPRNAALAQIAQQAHAQVAPDLQAFDEDTGEIEAAPVTPDPVEPEPVEPEAAPVVAAQPEVEVIVVDGHRLEVPRDKLLEAGRRTLQKESAADKRLQEATELKRQWEARINGAAPSSDAQLQQQPTTAFDPAALVQSLDQQIESKLYVREANKAAQQFLSEFKDIAENPMAMKLAVALENERLAVAAALGEPPGDPWEAYRKHGEAIRQHFGMKPVTPRDKTELKRSISTVPAASARAPAPQVQRPKTTSEIIAEQRKARHQRVE